MSKAFEISKRQVWEAWKAVKGNKGAPGIDGQSIEDFESHLGDNLYKIWNRMSAGSYFPPPVRGVEIPKKNGGSRLLGIPTVSDRIAQTVAQRILEKELEPHFHPDSYGYRPGKSALDAVAITRERCWKMDWVLEFDVRGLFDNISHELLLRAVRHHNIEYWVVMYVQRWLKASIRLPDGSLCSRNAGTPQGGCVSPVLANLFMHYTFDAWMKRTYPQVLWCRYADDGLVHCRTHKDAVELLEALTSRFTECGLELHPEKTKIVYCGDSNRKQRFEQRKFSFLGYEFRSRVVKSRGSSDLFMGFTPAICPKALKAVRTDIKECFAILGTHVPLSTVVQLFNPKLRGWLTYYGRFNRSALAALSLYFNQSLMNWARHKFGKLFKRRWARWKWLHHRFKENPHLFVNWKVFKVCSTGAG